MCYHYIMIYIYIHVIIHIYIYIYTHKTETCGDSGDASPAERPEGIHYRGVQWEGGAVDGGSIM